MSYTHSLAEISAGNVQVSITATPIYEITDLSLTRPATFATVTNVNSSAEEFLYTLAGSASLDMTYNRIATDPGQIAVEASFVAKTLCVYTIQLGKDSTQTTTGDLYTLSGFVESHDSLSGVSPTKQIMTKAKIKISGPVVLTPGS